MATFISSNANRFYTVLESSFGVVPAISAANRIPALKLAIRQALETLTRRDKTGSRTFGGTPAGGQATDGIRTPDVSHELGPIDRGTCLRAAVSKCAGGGTAAVHGP